MAVNMPPNAKNRVPVITSYSIHYTKLYDICFKYWANALAVSAKGIMPGFALKYSFSLLSERGAPRNNFV